MNPTPRSTGVPTGLPESVIGHLPAELVAALTTWSGRDRVLLALDFDGCLSPIVPDPKDARPLPAAREALHRLSAAPGVQLALVSGRPLNELRELADPPDAAVLIGSHGAQVEPLLPGYDHDADHGDPAGVLLDRLTAAVQEIVDRHPGTVLERKPTGAVLHTRRAPRPAAEQATREALAGPATWPDVHLTQGKEVVELAVTDVTKGDALARLRAAVDLPAGSGGVLYAGDDVTDERAFAVLDDDAGDVTVKVGEGATLARYRVPDPQAVARMLQAVVALRAG
jgi:trehalose-phosphatase